jgi:predicted RNase H-like HicB family nuclease
MNADDAYPYLVVKDTTTTGQPCFVATHPDLDGCMASGWTPEEAVRNLDDARGLYLADLRARGLPVPEPRPLSGVAAHAS